MAEQYFFGQHTCSASFNSGTKKGQKCDRKAYYIENDSLKCGIHSKKDQRQQLAKDPNDEILKMSKMQDDMKIVEYNATENKKNGKKGQVIVSKLKMMKLAENVEGFKKVFPNFKHANRKDGYGCAGLSPKSIGPINHIMPNLPPAKNLENFHQYSKVFVFELDEQENQKAEYFQGRIEGYLDPIAHRHKHDPKMLKKLSKNINIAKFSIFYDNKGTEHRFNYLESRYFYCKVYERMATIHPQFKHLKELLDNGYNLQIVGYDGYKVDKSLVECYNDTSKPYGHELVLYTLLTVENTNDYPWNIMYENNKNLYFHVGI